MSTVNPCLTRAYGFSEREGGGYSVHKPHGSINWFPVSNIVVSADGRRPEHTDQDDPRGGRCSSHDTHNEYDKLPRKHCILELKSSLNPVPLIAVYCKGKPPVRNPLCFEHVRANAHEALSRADEVLIIGCTRRSAAVRGDDPFLEEAFDRFATCPLWRTCRRRPMRFSES